MNDEQTVEAKLPQDMLQELERIAAAEHVDQPTTVRRLLASAIAQWKLDYYARQYADRKLSFARAAQEAGVSLWELMEYVRAKGIPSQYGLEELEQDLQRILHRS